MSETKPTAVATPPSKPADRPQRPPSYEYQELAHRTKCLADVLPILLMDALTPSGTKTEEELISSAHAVSEIVCQQLNELCGLGG
jgi:hypothetical protein